MRINLLNFAHTTHTLGEFHAELVGKNLGTKTRVELLFLVSSVAAIEPFRLLEGRTVHEFCVQLLQFLSIVVQLATRHQNTPLG